MPQLSSNGVNDPRVSTRTTFNTFDLSHDKYSTFRFGEITPVLNIELAPGDRVQQSVKHDLRNFTLEGLLMSPLQMHRDFCKIPLKSILPHTYKFLIPNPQRGDDLPEDAKPSVDFVDFIEKYLDILRFPSFSADLTPSYVCDVVLRFLHLFSRGSLLDALGYPTLHTLGFNDSIFDFLNGIVDLFDEPIPGIGVRVYLRDSTKIGYSASGKIVTDLVLTDETVHLSPVAVRRLTEFIDQGCVFKFYVGSLTDPVVAQFAEFNSSVEPALTPYLEDFFSFPPVFPENSDIRKINLSHCLAYQLACSEFYTRVGVDDVYDYSVFMEYLPTLSLYCKSIDSSVSAELPVFPSFKYNGYRVYYDVISRHIFQYLTSTLDPSRFYQLNYMQNFLVALFGTANSIRYLDYFNGARVRPLAVGNVNIPVVGNIVSAVDVTKNIVLQRFLNTVNRVGNRLHEYIQDIFGVSSPVEDTHPVLISQQTFGIGEQVTVNSADDQGDQTTLLHSEQDNFVFDYDNGDDFSILLGLTYFSVREARVGIFNKELTHSDRFEYLNPSFQTIGDQPVKVSELVPSTTYDGIFAYQNRYGEYQQRPSVVTHIFSDQVPFAFINDRDTDFIRSDRALNHIDSVSIRNFPSELDPFFKSLTARDYTEYFHFYARHSFQISILRNLMFNPSIL